MAVGTGTALLLGGSALLSAGSGIASSLISADASRDAAREQRRALQQAQQQSDIGFQRAQDLQQPFLESGTQAFNQLSDIVQQQALQGPAEQPQFSFGLEDIQSDPGIQFAQEQARKSVEASAAARGGALGGGTLQELQERAVGLSGLQSQQAFNRKLGGFQQNFAGRQQGFNEQQQLLNNLMGVAQVGPQTASNLANQAIGQAGRAGDLGIQMGNVNAAGRAAQGQALSQGISSGANTLQDLLLIQSLGLGGNQTQAPVNTGVGDLSRGLL